MRRLVATAAFFALAATPLESRGADAAAPLEGRATGDAPLVALAVPPAEASGASGAIDPAAATRAYLDRQSTAERARSDAYFEGGYWLLLADFLWSSASFLLLLASGLSARMRGLADRLVRPRALRAALYWAQFAMATAALGFPLVVYRDHLREHRYGLSNLSLAAWLGEQGKALLIAIVLGGLAAAVGYALLRRAGRRWWLWASVAAVAFLALGAVVTPIVLVPIFNHPTRLADGRVTAPILSLARASGIAAQDVWEVDASRQSKRIGANVAGFLGTGRITLNDNLLRRCSLPEIEAVMGHEMGHDVLNHVFKFLLQLGLVVLAGFALAAALFERLRARFPGWGVRGADDPAGLPLLALLVGAWFFLVTPVTNGIVRTQEVEADLYGLQAARQPDGFAQVALKLGEYRKLDPGPLEEAIFFDHPSGRTRIFAAMRWKAEHPETWSRR